MTSASFFVRFRRGLLIQTRTVGICLFLSSTCRATSHVVANDTASNAMLRTDQEQYEFIPAAADGVLSIAATLKNEFPFALFVVRCQESALFAIEKRVGDKWETVWETVCLLKDCSVIVVAPRTSYDDARRIVRREWRPVLSSTQINGVYRARYGVFTQFGRDSITGKPVAEPAPDEARFTNQFTIIER